MIRELIPRKKNDSAVSAAQLMSDVPDGIVVKCPKCKKIIYSKDLHKNLKVCVECNHYFSMSALERIESLLDQDSFVEYDERMTSNNPLGFPGYEKKLESDQKKTDLKEAILTGEGTIQGHRVTVAVMDTRFRMGSMGSVVGEKITRAIEFALEKGHPFIIFTASGGARMQEGILSLMQMAKTSSAAKMLDLSGNLFISVMTSPTTGGVSASFASLGDYNFAEPGALIGFAGRRIIEQTIREKLPDEFQTAEFLLKHGQLDKILPRDQIRSTLTTVLRLHSGGRIQ